MSWTIRSPSCSQTQDVAGEPGLLGIVRQQVAQEQRGALDVAAGLVEERQQLGVGRGRREQRHGRTVARDPGARTPAVYNLFTATSPRG